MGADKTDEEHRHVVEQAEGQISDAEGGQLLMKKNVNIVVMTMVMTVLCTGDYLSELTYLGILYSNREYDDLIPYRR